MKGDHLEPLRQSAVKMGRQAKIWWVFWRFAPLLVGTGTGCLYNLVFRSTLPMGQRVFFVALQLMSIGIGMHIWIDSRRRHRNWKSAQKSATALVAAMERGFDGMTAVEHHHDQLMAAFEAMQKPKKKGQT